MDTIVIVEATKNMVMDQSSFGNGFGVVVRHEDGSEQFLSGWYSSRRIAQRARQFAQARGITQIIDETRYDLLDDSNDD